MNEKWYSLSINEIEQKLKTNAASGLTRKAARSRMRKSGGNGFFFVGQRSAWLCARSVLSDPTLLLLIAMIAVAAIFKETAIAVSSGILVLLNLIFMIPVYIRSQRMIESMSGYSQPKVRVIRDGELFLADSRSVVPGDVLLISAGDVLPCDARVINSSGLKVRIYTGEDNDPVMAQPSSDVVYSPNENLEFYNYVNTVFAGSVVVSGEGRVLVTETGDTTYIGALEGGMALNDPASGPFCLKTLKRFSKIYGLIVLLAILPLTVAGIISYGPDKMLGTFLLILSLSVSALSEMIYVIGHMIIADTLVSAAQGKNGVMIKRIDRTEDLATADTVVLIGRSALTDGSLRITSAFSSGKVIRGAKIAENTDLILACDRIMSVKYAESYFPATSGLNEPYVPTEFDKFSAHLGVDTESIRIRSVPISCNRTGNDVSAKLNDGGVIVNITVSGIESKVDECYLERSGGELVVLSGERKNDVKKFCRKAMNDGCRVFIVVSRAGSGPDVLDGVFAAKETVSDTVKNSVEKLQKSGVEVVYITEGNTLADRALAYDAGIVGHKNLYLGLPTKDHSEVIRSIKKEGHKVIVFGSEPSCLSSFIEADVAVTCDRAVYNYGKDDIERLEAATPTGDPKSRDGAQVLRFSSDVLVKRASVRGGGIEGIVSAMSCAGSILSKIKTAVAYLIVTQIIRIVLTVPAIFTGRDVISSFVLLLSGLILDMAFMAIMTVEKRAEKNVCDIDIYDLKKPWIICKDFIIPATVASFVTSMTAIILSFVVGCNVSGAVAVSLFLSQLAAVVLVGNKKKTILPYAVATAAVLVPALIIACIPGISVSVGLAFSAFSLVCVPITPGALILSYIILRRIKKQK